MPKYLHGRVARDADLARCFLINLAADIFDDAASPGIKLIEGEDFGRPDIPSKQFEASDLVIVADNLRQISYDKVAAWLDGVDDIACPGTCLVLQVVAKMVARKFEGRFLYLGHGTGNLFRYAPASGPVCAFLQQVGTAFLYLHEHILTHFRAG